jgi:hypothetical protein
VARLTDDVIVETDATELRIHINPYANISPGQLKVMLQQLGNLLLNFRLIDPATMAAQFYRPESAQAALNRLSHESHIQSRLRYGMYFTSPGEIAS